MGFVNKLPLEMFDVSSRYVGSCDVNCLCLLKLDGKRDNDTLMLLPN